ncbi:DUF4256 family protein [Candidatus Peribacteria bacterium]|nr:DUF4256 family protein [Candidatus Peribacteria bacterium]
MKAVAEEKVADEATATPAISDERRDEIRDELSNLDEQERAAVEALGEAQAELARIQTERRELMDELLGDAVQPDALELTPAMADGAINALKAEFDKGADETRKAGYRVQEGMDFAAVEAKLRATENEEQLKAVYRMVQAGSRPAVVCEEGGRYCIAETFGQTLSERANCVYDRKAERQVGRENCNGNAVTQSQKIGVPLMEGDIAKAHMVEFPDTDQYCYDYIQATPEERERGGAPCASRYSGGACVRVFNARNHGDFRGWRGALWV